MATNTTPQYHKAEEAYRRAATPDEELKWLEVMLKEVPKHKASEKLQSDLKSKISRLKKEVEADRKAGPKGGPTHRLVRQGAGTAVLLGGPNAGKSRLLAALTRATPEVAPYPFTTRVPQPGMMAFEDILVQLIDLPPVTKDYLEPYLQGFLRGADVVLLLADLGSDDGVEQLQEVLDRLAGTKTRLGRESRLDDDDVGLSFTRTLFVPNKIDLPESADRLALLDELCPLDFERFPISAEAGTGLDALRTAVFRAIDVVRVYTKLPHARGPDLDRPFTVRRGGCVLDVAEMVHRDLAENFKFARLWGAGVHDGAQVKGDHVLSDKDVIEIHA